MTKHPRILFNKISHFYWLNFYKSKKRHEKRSLKNQLEANKRYQNKMNYLMDFKGYEPF